MVLLVINFEAGVGGWGGGGGEADTYKTKSKVRLQMRVEDGLCTYQLLCLSHDKKTTTYPALGKVCRTCSG